MRTVPANCRHCDKAFERPFRRGGTQRFCSETCRARAYYLKVNERPEKPCTHCGATIPAGSHANRDYCSKTCKTAVDSVVAKAKYPGTYTPRRYGKSCVTCGISYIAKRKHGKACSQKCLNKYHLTVPAIKAQLRQRADARKAMVRGAERALKFSAAMVLDRDGWTCQECGVSTPKELRGTTQPNAPELDHIVPLCRGGDHTPENTQCLCMKCNRAKSAKVAA